MRVDQTRFRPDPTSTSTHGAEAAQPLLRLFRPHRERKAVSVRLLRPHRGRKAVSASVRLLRPHRGRKAVSALSRCAVSHLECHICRSQFGIVKEKYRHCIHTMLHPWTCLFLVEQPSDCTRASTYRAGDGDAQARGCRGRDVRRDDAATRVLARHGR